MDITGVLGDEFGAIIYIALYTSKVEKHKDFNYTIKKMSSLRDDANAVQKVRKILSSSENTKIVSAAEAAHNLLEYPHWNTSCQIIRTNAKSYIWESIEKNEEDLQDNSYQHENKSSSERVCDEDSMGSVDVTNIFEKINHSTVRK